jgi:ribonuclease HI
MIMSDTPVSTTKSVTLYTDGACLNNPGPGGYGVILIAGDRRKELSAGYRLTTNNRMEILAVIAGLQTLRYPCRVTVYSDSRYVVDTMAKGWAKRWRAQGWRRSDKAPAVNSDLWEQLLQLCERHEVTFEWVKGHDGHPENERCDRLSVAAASGRNLLEDTGYAATPSVSEPRPGQAQASLPLDADHTTGAVSISTLSSQPFIGKPDNRAASVRCDDAWMYLTFLDRRELRVPLAWLPALLVAPAMQRSSYLLLEDGRTFRFTDLQLEIDVDQLLGIAPATTGKEKEVRKAKAP